ncbi:hypothetical protein GGU10DRAFT_367985, partial [Lentinula aff. detonsa]
TITGAMKSSPTDLLDIHAGLLPMDLLLKKICHRAVLRLYTLPKQNPVTKIAIEAFRKQNVTKMSTPLRLLPLLFNLPPPTEVETISLPNRPGHWDIPIDIQILKKEDATEIARNAPTNYKIFSDGSGHNGMVGAAAVLYKQGELRPEATIRYLSRRRQKRRWEAIRSTAQAQT